MREHLQTMEANKQESDDEFDFDDDEISNKIMEERMAQMRSEASEQMSWQKKGHGKLEEIVEEEFLKTVTKSKYAVVHFYTESFPDAKIVDHHLEVLAKKYLATKFA